MAAASRKKVATTAVVVRDRAALTRRFVKLDKAKDFKVLLPRKNFLAY
jgi:hypothetical protein